MPFSKRTVKPRRLVGNHVDEQNQFELEIFCNIALVSALQQLSNLAEIADAFFSELTDELIFVVRRADNVKRKLDNISSQVSKLNAKSVNVPEGVLKTYANMSKHYHHDCEDDDYGTNMFIPEKRSGCIQKLCEKADDDQMWIPRSFDAEHSCCKAKQPVSSIYLDDACEHDTQTEVTSTVKKPLRVVQAGCRACDTVGGPDATFRPLSLSSFPEIDVRARDQHSLPLTGPDKISKSHPTVMVPIDITGIRFDRMCENRKSTCSSNEQKGGTLKRKKRRQTVSGAPGLVFDEISKKLFNMGKPKVGMGSQSRSVSHERPKSAALEYYAPREQQGIDRKSFKDREKRREKNDVDESALSRSCSLRRSLRSLFKDKRSKSTDLWAEGRPRSPGLPVVDLNCKMKRSSSMPRSLKSVMATPSYVSEFDRERSASTEGYLDARSSMDHQYVETKKICTKKGKEAQVKSKIPRSVSHGANWCDSTFVDNLPRQQSMHTVPHSESGSQSHPSSDSLTLSTTHSSNHVCKKGQHIHVHIPDKPWTKPFSKVKLRLKRKQKTDTKSERQSSSGHWSISSSTTRQSLESDCRCSATSPERTSSCDRDSAVSFNIHGSERYNHRISEETSTFDRGGDIPTINGSSYGDGTSIDSKHIITKISTSEWLKQMKFKKSQDILHTGITESMKSNNSPEGAQPAAESWLTMQNLKAHDNAHLSINKNMTRFGESSMYKLDPKDLNNPLHMDYGTRQYTMEILGEEKENINMYTANQDGEVGKELSTEATHVTSFLDTLKGKKLNDKKSPPPPPPRAATTSSTINTPLTFFECSPATSELKIQSQHEASTGLRYVGEHIRPDNKSSVFPSSCAANPNQKDDEDIDMLEFRSAWKQKDEVEAHKQDTVKQGSSLPAPVIQNTGDSPITKTSIMGSSYVHGKDSSDIGTGQFNTWPSLSRHRQATNVKPEISNQLKPPESLTIKPPNIGFIYSDEKFSFLDNRHPLPEARTPDSVLVAHGFKSPTNNTFRDTERSSTSLDGGQKMPKSDTEFANSILLAQKCLNSIQKPEKSADWTSTWPRRKAVSFTTSSQAVIRDDTLVSMNSGASSKSGIIRKSNTCNFHTKGDSAHYIGSTHRQFKPPTSLALGGLASSSDPHAAHAKLVISSPVGNRACFVENTNKRSICSPVTSNELQRFWNYSSSDKWYNTLPRSNKPENKRFSFSNEDKSQENEENNEPAINLVPQSRPLTDIVSPAVLDEDPASSKRPPSKPLYPSIVAMKHSLTFPARANNTANRKHNPTNYGRTWYDGVDAPSTVVVMNPDGYKTWKGTQTSFTAFLREQNSGSSLGMPPWSRRDSTVSSISTNSSGSAKRPDTLAHRLSSSRLSKTSLDAVSITSSQTSGSIHSDIKSNRRVPIDDDVQETRQDHKPVTTSTLNYKEPPVILSKLKRSSSCDSVEDRPLPPLETIIGSDSESFQNLEKDNSFASNESSTLPLMAKIEPNAKRQKTVVLRHHKTNRHRPSHINKNKHVTTSFVGPVINVDLPVNNVLDQNVNELKPMPLISTSFFGAMKSGNRSENTSVPLSVKSKFSFPAMTNEKQTSIAHPLASDKVVLPMAPNKTETNSKIHKSEIPPAPKQGQNKLKDDHLSSNAQNSNTSKLKSFYPKGKILSETTSKSNCSPKMTAPASFANPAQTCTSSSVTSSIPITSAISTRHNKSSVYTISSKTITPASSVSKASALSGSPTTTTTHVPQSIWNTGQAKPTPPKFILPKLQPWNPSLYNSKTSSLVSKYTGEASLGGTPGKSSDVQIHHGPSASSSNENETTNKLSAASHKKEPFSVNSQNMPEKLSTKDKKPVNLDKSPSTRVAGNTSLNLQEKLSTKDENPVNLDKSHSTRVAGNTSLNQSLVDLSELQPQSPLNKNKDSLHKSTSCLNKWSSTDFGSSALSLARSATSLTVLNQMNFQSDNLFKSSLSLAASTDSLASNSSTADRSRAAKLAFLTNSSSSEQRSTSSVDNRFSSYHRSQKKLNASRTSLISLSEQPESSVDFGTAGCEVRRSSTSSKSSMSSMANSRKSSASSNKDFQEIPPSPIQGKFVSSILGKLQKKGVNTSMTKISQSASGSN